MRKPTRAAWLVNQLARHEADGLAQALDLGEALSAAHREAAGDRLRELTRLRTQLIAALVDKAGARGAGAGYHAPESARQEVAETLTAALADSKLADLIKAGLLVQCVRASAFGPVDMFSPVPGVIALTRKSAMAGEDEPAADETTNNGAAAGSAPAASGGTSKIPDLAQVRAAERALVTAESRVENAESDRRRVLGERDRAIAERERLNRAVDELRHQLMNAEERLAEADIDMGRAAELVRDADRAVDDAENHLGQAQERIRELGLES